VGGVEFAVRVVEGEVPDAVAGHLVAPLPRPALVPVHHRHTGGRQGVVDVALGVGDHLQAAKALDVGGHDVVHHADVGPGDGAQVGDLPGAAGAHLDHREAMVFFQGQQGEGHPDVVVEVAPGGEGGGEAAEDGGAHVLDGGRPDAAGDGERVAGELLARQQGDLGQGLGGV